MRGPLSYSRLLKSLALAAAGLIAGPLAFQGNNALERFFIDLRFFLASSLRAEEKRSERLALIRMDSVSADILSVPQGTKWRQFHPQLMRILKEAGAGLIVFDSRFVDREPEWDDELRSSFVKAGNVIAGEDEPGTTPSDLRNAFSAVGGLRMRSLGRDRTPRFVPVGPAVEGSLKPLAVVAAEQDYRRGGGNPPPEWCYRPPGFWIDFRCAPDYFPSFSYEEVFHAAEGRLKNAQRTPLSIFSGRIVLIGLDDPASLRDYFTFPNTLGRMYPGVYGHAFALETILRGRPVLRAGPWTDAGASLLLIVFLLAALRLSSRRLRTALLVLLPVASFLLALALLAAPGYWLGFAPLFVSFWTVLVLHWLHGRILLAVSLRKAFGFDPRLLEAFRRESRQAGGALRRDVAILIADVRGYTRLVSSKDPAEVSRIMSEYLSVMERCITEHGGYINKYVGDEIIAVFGFPLDCLHCSSRAVRAGLAMQAELGRLQALWRKRGLAGIERIGIGIDAGPATFAEMGGRTKSQFDIIGDCVNGASRIENLTKDLAAGLLISEEAYRGLEEEDRMQGSFCLLKNAVIRGQGRRNIYAPIGAA